jgi:hypothetical protein
MYKLITFAVAAIPVVLFLRTLFGGKFKKSQSLADLKKHIDYVVSAILVCIGCAVAYAVVKLIWP